MELERTIVIVGAGFSGTAAAINLLRLGSVGPLRIVLVDPAQAGRGTAYANREYPYLLNVPAGRMATSSADPLGFVEFARQRLPRVNAEDFLPRSLYGDYLEANLRAAELTAPRHIQLVRLRGDAICIARAPIIPHLRVHLRDGNRVHADQVVLALGNPPPAQIPGAAVVKDAQSSEEPRYVEDPWAAPLDFRRDETLLVVGTGLTMADVVTAAADATEGRVIVHAISRRGLVPPSQTTFQSQPGAPAEHDSHALLGSAARSMRTLMRTVRELCDRAERNGGDWREAITLVRHLAPDIWNRMTVPERRRFLRHARSFWDVHRHRLPELTLESLNRLRRADRLHVHAGRIAALAPHGEQVRVTWRRRGEERLQTLLVDRVINCTGPDYDVRRSRHPLLRSLLEEGIAVSDPLGLGLKTGAHGALIDRDGRAASDLYYLGPMLRADWWEATAVPELRQHAERLARHLVARGETRTVTRMAV